MEKYMSTEEIVAIIREKFNNTLFFNTSVNGGKITIEKKTKSIELDLDNDVSETDLAAENSYWFLIETTEKVADVLDDLSGHEDRDICKQLVDVFVEKHNLDSQRPLYLNVRLSPQ